MRMRDYRAGDEQKFTPRPDFYDDFIAAGCRLPEGPKWTFCDDTDEDLVKGVAGFTGMGPRQWGAWAYLCQFTPREWLWSARRAREMCAWACVLPEAGAQVYAIPAPTDEARRLLAYIGFRPTTDPDDAWKFEES